MRRTRTFLAGVVALGLTSPLLAADYPRAADGFPERALTMVIPYGPGGGSAQFGGAITDAFTEVTGVSVNKDHKPGGSGAVGLTAYMAMPHDGYTILEHIDDIVSMYALRPESTPNPTEDLVPLMTGQITFSQIYIRSDEDRFTDWDSFIAYVMDNPGQVTVANVAREGSMERLNLKFITDHYGAEIQQISFDKPTSRYASLLGGQVDALLEQPGDVTNFLDSGDFKPILTIFEERPSAFADVPTIRDKGMEFEPLLRFRMAFVHADAPKERVEWLQKAYQAAFERESFQKFNKRKYMHLIDSFRDSEGTIELIESTLKIYRDAYEELGLIDGKQG